MSTIPTSPAPRLSFAFDMPLVPENAGRFVSRGEGRHPERILDSFEAIFVVSGLLGISEEGRGYSVPAGEYLVLSPGRRHWGTEDYGPELEFYWMHFRMKKNAGPGFVSTGSGIPIIGFPVSGRVGNPDRLVELFRWFLDEQEKFGPGAEGMWMPCLAIISFMARGEGSRPPDDRTLPLFARQARLVVARRFTEATSTRLIAADLGCNPDYLGRIYKKSFGVALMDDLHGQRIRLAKSLLMDGNLNINEVAFRCGYTDIVHFRRMFRRFEGTTPKTWRALNSRMHLNAI